MVKDARIVRDGKNGREWAPASSTSDLRSLNTRSTRKHIVGHAVTDEHPGKALWSISPGAMKRAGKRKLDYLAHFDDLQGSTGKMA